MGIDVIKQIRVRRDRVRSRGLRTSKVRLHRVRQTRRVKCRKLQQIWDIVKPEAITGYLLDFPIGTFDDPEFMSCSSTSDTNDRTIGFPIRVPFDLIRDYPIVNTLTRCERCFIRRLDNT